MQITNHTELGLQGWWDPFDAGTQRQLKMALVAVTFKLLGNWDSRSSEAQISYVCIGGQQ